MLAMRHVVQTGIRVKLSVCQTIVNQMWSSRSTGSLMVQYSVTGQNQLYSQGPTLTRPGQTREYDQVQLLDLP